jgi:hypothetical protein
MRYLAACVIGAILCAVLPTAALATNAPGCKIPTVCEVPLVNDHGYRYSFDGGDLVAAPVLSGRSGSGPAWEFVLLPACAGNVPPDPDNVALARDVFCAAAVGPPRCAPGEVWMRVYGRVVGSAGPWQVRGTRCVGAPRRVPVAAVLAGVRERLDRLVAPPVFEVQPAGRAIVNLPVIVHVVAEGRRRAQSDCAHPQGVCFDVTVPVPGRLEAYPTYGWVFDAGAVASGRGRAYDGTSPREDPGHYVAHTYRVPVPRQPVRLTVTWKAQFSVPGLPPLELADLPKSSVRTFPVVEARSQLVAG